MQRTGLAIFLIISIAIAVFFLSPSQQNNEAHQIPTPSPEEQELLNNKGIINRIIITKADWGLNCDGKLILSDHGTPAGKGEHSVQPDNATEKLREICNNKALCETYVNEETIGFDPAPNCEKHVFVKFRCFDFDRPREMKHMGSRPLVIDCKAIMEEQPQQ